MDYQQISKKFDVLSTLVLSLIVIFSSLLISRQTFLLRSKATIEAITLEGVLEIYHHDDFENKKSFDEYLLKVSEDKWVKLDETSADFEGIGSGSKIRINGYYSGDKFTLLQSQEGSIQIVEPEYTDYPTCYQSCSDDTNCSFPTLCMSGTCKNASCPDKTNCTCAATTGIIKVAVILINFTNDTSELFTVDKIRETIFTGTNSVNNYYKEASYHTAQIQGKLAVDGDIFGWYTLNEDVNSCQLSYWAKLANQKAAAAGVDLTGYDNYVYIHPPSSGCAYAASAVLAGNRVFLHGTLNAHQVAHELGHNYGLHHASAYACFDTSGKRVPISENCTKDEYGDRFDIMGFGNYWHFSNFNKGRLEWIKDDKTQTVTQSGVYRVGILEFPSVEKPTIRIPRTKDANGNVSDYYYLEFRVPYGFDNFSSTDPVSEGITIRIAPSYSTLSKSLLLDASPENDFNNVSLRPDRVFYDSAKQIYIKYLQSEQHWGKVWIYFGQPPTTTPDNYRVFISSQKFMGDLRESSMVVNGTDGADVKCQRLAQTAGIGNGIFKAWISDSFSNAVDRIRPKISLPYKLVDNNTLIANNLADLTDANINAPINKDEYGKAADPGSIAFTNTNVDGTKTYNAEGIVNRPCSNWSRNFSFTFGGKQASNYQWTIGSLATDCKQNNHLYCFETEHLLASSSSYYTSPGTTTPSPSPTPTPKPSPTPTLAPSPTSIPSPIPSPTPFLSSILRNASFETPKSGNSSIPDTWSRSNSSDSRISYSGAANGSYVFRFSPSVSSTTYKNLRQDNSVIGKKGDLWELKVWSKVDNTGANGTIRARIRFINSSGSSTVKKIISKSSGSYQTFSDIVAPRDYTSVKIFLDSSITTGYVYYDDVSLVRK